VTTWGKRNLTNDVPEPYLVISDQSGTRGKRTLRDLRPIRGEGYAGSS
jgi:hypothetical protein